MALTLEDTERGLYEQVGSMELEPKTVVKVYLEQVEFHLLLTRGSLHKRGRLRRRLASGRQRPDSRLRWADHDLPEKVEREGVSQVVEGERRTRQVSYQGDKDALQPRLLFDLRILQAGADEARNVDEPLRAAFAVVRQGGLNRLRGATKPPTPR